LPKKTNIARKKRRGKRAPLDGSSRFEKLLKGVAGDRHFSLQLYISGSTPRSSKAVANIRSMCEQHLPGRYDLEVIDIYQQPEHAVLGQIIAAPTLIKRLPLPLRRLIGNLSDQKKLLVALNIEEEPGAARSKTKA
jgi:circadian clock protein KaiB